MSYYIPQGFLKLFFFLLLSRSKWQRLGFTVKKGRVVGLLLFFLLLFAFTSFKELNYKKITCQTSLLTPFNVFILRSSISFSLDSSDFTEFNSRSWLCISYLKGDKIINSWIKIVRTMSLFVRRSENFRNNNYKSLFIDGAKLLFNTNIYKRILAETHKQLYRS